MLKLIDLVAELRELHARGIAPEQLARWMERRGYAQVYSASLLMEALDLSAHAAAVAVCASGTWTSRTTELAHVERRLALVCERSSRSAASSADSRAVQSHQA